MAANFDEWCASKGLSADRCDDANMWIREAYEAGQQKVVPMHDSIDTLNFDKLLGAYRETEFITSQRVELIGYIDSYVTKCISSAVGQREIRLLELVITQMKTQLVNTSNYEETVDIYLNGNHVAKQRWLEGHR